MAISFSEVVDVVRERLQTATPAPPAPTTECLSFAELRRLALRPEEAIPMIEEHLRSCNRCSRTAASCRRELHHLPWWTLLGVELGRLSPEEERIVQYHLREGRCTLCSARLQRVTGNEALQVDPLFPPFGHAAQETPRKPTLSAYFPGGYYEVELLQSTPHFECEIRTKSEALRSYVFAFSCYRNRPQGNPLVGYTVLGEEKQGYYSGRLLAENPGSPWGVGFSGTYIVALRPVELREEEVDQLLAVVQPTLAESHVRAQWTDWLRRVMHSPGAEQGSALQRLVRELEIQTAR